MKILMTTDTGGGVWTYAVQLADELSKQAVQVVLATLGEPLHHQQKHEAHAIPGLNLFESQYPSDCLQENWEDSKQWLDWLLYLEELTRPDVIHLNHIACGPMPFKAPRIVVAHSCKLAWHRAVKAESPVNWQTYINAVRPWLNDAQAIITPTRSGCESLSAIYGLQCRSTVIPHGRRRFTGDIGPKWPFIISAGRPSDEANNVALIKNAASHLSWPVWLAGEAPLTRGYNHRKRGNVHMLGQLPFSELSRWLQRAAIYCLPTKYEPFGMNILEAGLCGCALVLGDIPSLREIWGNAALYVPPDDCHALTTTLQNLISIPELREKYAAMAYERAIKYSPERMATAYLNLYHELARSNSYNLSMRTAACAS